MKEGRDKGNPKERKSIIVTILISVIVILVLILGYGVYSGFKVKAAIEELNNMNSQLNAENQQLKTDFNSLHDEKDILQKKYDMLYQDVQNIYKSCITQNACKGRFPGVSWFCNNVGDEVSDPSHTCICDSSCNLKTTQLT
jgi:cell division protein FtsB